MNPDRHATSHYDYFKNLIKGDDASTEAHRKFYDEYNAVLDMDADYYLETISTVFQEFELVNGTWDVKGADGKLERVRPRGHHDHRAAYGRRRAGRHLRLGPDRGRARPVQRHADSAAAAPGSQGRGPLRHLQRPPLARVVYPQVRDFIRELPPSGAGRRQTAAAPSAPPPRPPREGPQGLSPACRSGQDTAARKLQAT